MPKIVPTFVLALKSTDLINLPSSAAESMGLIVSLEAPVVQVIGW